MGERFKIDDHITWNSEAGQVSGRIIDVHKHGAQLQVWLEGHAYLFSDTSQQPGLLSLRSFWK
jgi:hypothetical protein